MTITSNIAGVIRQVERLRVNVPLAEERALARPEWEAEAVGEARRTLLALADPAQRQFIEPFIQTVKSWFAQPVRSFEMKSPFGELLEPFEAIAAARLARENLNPADLSQSLFLKPVQDFEDLILQWVQTDEADFGKARDARDLGKMDEEIAHLISYIMLSPKLGPKGMAARGHLTQHIARFLVARQQPLDAATIDAWLRAVLAAWRVLVVKLFPGKMRAELRAMKGEL